jgi:hypothetical protein
MATKKIVIEYDINGKPIDVIIDKTVNLKQAFRLLTAEISKTEQGTKEFELLSTKLGDVKDRMESTTAKSRDLFGSLSLLPGPIGLFSNSIDSALGSLKVFSSFNLKDLKFQLTETLNDFKDIAINIGKATGVKKVYTTVTKALTAAEGEASLATKLLAGSVATLYAALGVGLILVLVEVGKALYEMATGEDAAAAASKRLNDQLESQNELLDLNAASTKRRNAETIAAMKAAGKSEKEIRDTTLKNAYKDYTDAYDAEVQAVKDYNKNIAKANEEDAKKLQKNLDDKVKARKDAYSAYLVLGYNNKAEENKAEDEKNKQLLEKNKQYQEKVKADNKTADDTLRDLKRENAALAIQDERKRQDKELENQKLAEEDKIKTLLISDEKKKLLINQIETKYKAKQTDVNNKRIEEDTKKEEEKLKTEEDFNRKVAEIKIAAIQDETNRSIAERQQKYKNDLSDLEKDKEFIKKSETEKAAIRKALRDTATADEEKIALEAKLKKDAIEKGDNDAKYARILAGTKNDLDTQRATLEAKRLADEEYYAKQLAAEGLNGEQIRQLNQQKLADQAAYTAASKELEASRVAMQQKALDDIISIAGAESDVGRAALIAKQILAAKELALEISKTITFSTQAAARSVVAVAEGTAQTAKIGFPQNIPMLIGYAAQAVAIISAIMSAVSSAKSSANSATSIGGPSGDSAAALGKNYGDGGMIEGPRHAQGGMMVNAEGGEAIMTRGAVTMFAPLLSTLNQMGGGTSFSKGAAGQANYDNPKQINPNIQPTIMKTYVVENELTTIQHKQARLKDLSTL